MYGWFGGGLELDEHPLLANSGELIGPLPTGHTGKYTLVLRFFRI